MAKTIAEWYLGLLGIGAIVLIVGSLLVGSYREVGWPGPALLVFFVSVVVAAILADPPGGC